MKGRPIINALRDQCIHEARQRGQTQREIAMHFEISQVRVSQILAKPVKAVGQ